MSFEYIGYKFLEKLSFLPKDVFIKTIGNLGFILDHKRKKVVLTNRKLSGLDFDVKKVYLNFARNLYETFELKRINKDKLKRKIEFEEFENLPNQVIFVTAHFGNWEILPLAIGAFIGEMGIIGRKLDNEKLNKEITTIRTKFNVTLYDRKGGLKNLIKDIKNKKHIGLLVDQNTAKNEGIETSFFGKKVLQTPSAALLSKRFNIPIAMVFSEPLEDKWKITIKDIFLETDIQKSVDRQSKVIEEEVRKFPEEYYWFHRRFKHFYEDEYK